MTMTSVVIVSLSLTLLSIITPFTSAGRPISFTTRRTSCFTIRGGSEASNISSYSPSTILPPSEYELNLQSHSEEIELNTKDNSYHTGPCTPDPTLSYDTIGYSIDNATTLPDFQSRFQNTWGNHVIRVSAQPILTQNECNDLIETVDRYFQNKSSSSSSSWTKLPSGRFEIEGTWIKDIPPLLQKFNTLLQTKLYPMLHRLFPELVTSEDSLCIQTAYLFKYTPEGGEKTDVHLDSSLLSFTILLNDESEFEGGGTYFEALEDNDDGVLEMRQGQVTFRPSGLRHRGQPIASGKRYVVGGFVTLKGPEGCEHVRQLLSRATRALTSGDTAYAKRLLELAIALNPEFSETYMSYAHCLRKSGDMEGALKNYRRVLELNPKNADAAFMVGVMLNDEFGREEEALGMYKKAVELNEYDGDAWYRQGLIHSRHQNPALERRMYLKALEVQPRHTDALCNLGVSYGENGETNEEIACYERVLELDPNHEDALNNYKTAKYYEGVQMFRDGKLEESAECFRNILDKIPDEKIIGEAYEKVLSLMKERDELKEEETREE